MAAHADAPSAPGEPLMTLRVSRDSGRTWGRKKSYYARDCLPPLLNSTMPPCTCPRCRERR
ncbi:hypothetical protein GCM10009802_55530 [Streptomyces synnematoformans]|uniref:Uncharacterized protein n=1 Tax=Streptomyces synnematoformans TaxID=415721 RepID=A0ABN1ZJY7_9ACTN